MFILRVIISKIVMYMS